MFNVSILSYSSQLKAPCVILRLEFEAVLYISPLFFLQSNILLHSEVLLVFHQNMVFVCFHDQLYLLDIFFTSSVDTSSPSCVVIDSEKKDLSFFVPNSVSTNLLLATLETVDISRPVISAMSLRIIGFNLLSSPVKNNRIETAELHTWWNKVYDVFDESHL
jgi:hypothetical protein